jgi:hypothetical protein
MSKKKEEQPFSGFSLLKGEFTAPVEGDDTVETGNPADIKDVEVTDEEAARLAEGDKVLAEAIEKQKAALAKKNKEETPEDTDTPEGDNDPNEDTGIKDFIKGLSEKGVIDFDDTDPDFEESEEGIEKLVSKTVQNRIDKWASALPEDFNKMLQFVEAGGDPKTFLEVYYGNHSWETFSIESEEAQKAAVKESLRLAGEDPADIEEIVGEWYDNGTLKKRAESAIKKLQKTEQVAKTQLVEQQKVEAEKRKAEEKAHWDSFKKDIFEREEIKGFKLTPKMKEKLWEFYSVPDKKTGKTGYQRATEQDTEAALLFGLQAMNGFDLSKLEKQVETKVSSKYANLLKNYSKGTKERMSGGVTPGYNDENPFSGFKTK